MNRQNAEHIGFSDRLDTLIAKEAGFLNALGKGLGRVGAAAAQHLPTGAAAAQSIGQGAKGLAGHLASKGRNLFEDIAGRTGSAVSGMAPGLGRRILGGAQHATSSPLNPAELGKSVLKRVGAGAAGAGVVGGSYVKGQLDAAAEAKRRASQLGFMQRLAFLMNPNIVNRM